MCVDLFAVSCVGGVEPRMFGGANIHSECENKISLWPISVVCMYLAESFLVPLGLGFGDDNGESVCFLSNRK